MIALWLLLDSLREGNLAMRPTYMRLLNTEIMIEPNHNPSFGYIKESAIEREIHLGKVKVLINTGSESSTNKFIWERFANR